MYLTGKCVIDNLYISIFELNIRSTENNLGSLGDIKREVYGCRDEGHDISDSGDQEFRRSEKRKKRDEGWPVDSLFRSAMNTVWDAIKVYFRGF